MAFTPLHAVVGMAVVTAIPNPWVSIPVAFASHAVLDLYPEWYNQDHGYDTKEIVMVQIEVFLLFAIILVLIHERSWLLLAGAVAANLIDLWDEIYHRITGRYFWFCHPMGWFPLRVEHWQEFGMRPMQTALLDCLFVGLILGLIVAR